MPKKFFNQNRRINTLHSETELRIPVGNPHVFDFEIKELWLAKWQEITKDKSSLKIFFSSCQRVKINQNF